MNIQELINRLIVNANEDGLKISMNESDRRVGGFIAFFHNAFYTQPQFNPNVSAEFIFMSSKLNDNRFLAILFHELAHATGHENRFNRISIANPFLKDNSLSGKEVNRLYSIEELIAERTSQKLQEYFRVICPTHYQISNDYINHYLLGNDLTELEAVKIEKQSDQAFQYIIDNWINQKQNLAKVA